MAQTDEYLSSLIRPRGQRKQRLGDIVDPLESASAMDSMQRANVSGGSSASMEPMGGGGANILRLASGGGGGMPVRTAQMTGDDDGPVQQTQYTIRQGGGTCRPGMPCYRGPTTVQSSPMETSTIVSSAPVITGERVISSTPVQTTVQSFPMESAPVSAMAPEASIRSLIGSAIGNAASVHTAPLAGAQMAGSKILLAAEDQQSRNSQFQQTLPYKAEAFMAASEDARAAARLKDEQGKGFAAEARLTEAQAELTEASTMLGMSDQEEKLLRRVISGEISAETAVKAAMTSRSRLPVTGTDEKQKRTMAVTEAGNLPFSPDAAYTDLTRKFTAGQAVGIVVFSEAAYRQANAGRDVNPEEVVKDHVGRFVDNYKSTGMFDRPWSEISMSLDDDVYRPLREVQIQRYTFGIDRNKDPAKWEAQAMLGVTSANAYYGAIRSKLETAWGESARGPQAGTSMSSFHGVGESKPVDSNETLPPAPSRKEAAPPGGYQMYGGRR